MEQLAILEGLLFVVGEDGISLEKIKDVIEINDDTLSRLISELENVYSDSKRGITLMKYGNRLKLTTKKEHHEYYEKLSLQADESILTQASLETLAIIAYNGPVTRMNVDEIRGINSSHIIRKLVSKNLVEDVGRADTPGKPRLYAVTDDFLDYFGLKDVSELPKIEEVELNDEEKDLFESKYKEIN